MNIDVKNMIPVQYLEDVPCGEDLLVYDGCDFHIDYVDVCADTGHFYWANESDATHYAVLIGGEDNDN